MADARFLLSNNFYVSCFPVPDIVITTVSVLCYKPFRPRRFVMNSVLCHVLSVINPLPARLDNYLVSGNWKCRPEFSSLFVSLIIPRLGRPSHSPGMWLETFKRDTIPLSIMWTVKKTQKYSFCFNLLLKTLNLQVSKFPSLHAGLGLDPPGLKLDDGTLAWMVNGCPLITDNDFQNFNHNIFFHLLYSLHSWKKQDLDHCYDGAKYTRGGWILGPEETQRERRGEAVSLTITLTLEYSRGQAAARTDAARRLNIKYERNIFPFFCCEWNHRGGCRHTRTHFSHRKGKKWSPKYV